MNRSELIEKITVKQKQLTQKDVEFAVKEMLEHMTLALSSGGRVEIRGFGSFSLHYRRSRVGRNPKTGEMVNIAEKHVPHFKPGKELQRVINHN